MKPKLYTGLLAGGLTLALAAASLPMWMIRAAAAAPDSAAPAPAPAGAIAPAQALAEAPPQPFAAAEPAAAPAPAAAAAPATQPAAPAASQPANSAAAFLDRVEEKSATIKSLVGDVTYDRIQGLVGDRQRRLGTLSYISGPPARFAIHFDRLIIDNALRPQDRWYVFNGVYLVERLNDEKQFTKVQVVPPNATAEQSDPLALGKGPFVLPLSARKGQILKRFEASIIPFASGDPASSVHLKLIPREITDDRFSRIDLWYDEKSLLPLRAQTVDDSQNKTIIELKDLKLNAKVADDLFNVSEPTEPGWRVEIKPYEQ